MGSKIGRWSLGPISALAVAIAVWTAGCGNKSVAEYLAAGDQALQRNDLAQAEQNYGAAAKAASNDPRTHVALGNLYVFKHNADAARQEFMRAVELDPKDVSARLGLGKLFLDQGQFALAEEQFLAAAALDPANPNAHMELASVAERTGKLETAEREFRTAIGLVPKDGQPHFALANFLDKQPARRADADVEYGRAQALDPRLARPAAMPTAAGAPAVAGVPSGAAPAPAAATAPVLAAPKIKPLDKKFQLTHNSPVYEKPDSGSRVVGQVHRRKYVHVVGITGDWLQVKLHDGTIGFIPTSAAE